MKEGGGKRGCRGSECTELVKLLVDMLLPVELRGDAVVWLVVDFFLEKNFSSLSNLCAMVLWRCREASVAAIGVVVVNNGIRRGGGSAYTASGDLRDVAGVR